MSSFFTAPASQRKRKRADDRAGKPTKRRGTDSDGPQRPRAREAPGKRTVTERDDSISGSGSDSDGEPEPGTGSDSEATSEEDETAADRRVRLAQRYLDNLREEVDEAGFDAEEIDKDLIAQRLKQDVDEQKGRQFRLIARTLDFQHAQVTHFRADTQSTTAVAVRQPYAYTASKDKTLIKWELVSPFSSTPRTGNSSTKPHPPKRRPKQMAFVKGVKVDASSSQQHGHTGAILSLAVSPDGKFVATGGADKKLIIWRASDLKPLKTFFTHRDTVTGLDFAPTSSQSGFGAQLFSASTDRCLKTYSLASEDSLAYVETLFGHQDHVLAVSAMSMDQCVSVGARDRSARLWRVVEETQLKFLGDSSRRDEYHTGSLDCVAALPPHHFVTGSDSGALSLWSIHKKKSLFTIKTAHGVEDPAPLEDVTSERLQSVIEDMKKHDTRRATPRAITALVGLPGTDVILSGSWDGWIRVWKLSDDKRTLLSLGVIGGQESTSGPSVVADTLRKVTIDENSTEHLNQEPKAGLANGFTIPQVNGVHTTDLSDKSSHPQPPPIKGVINSLALFERRKEIASEFGGKKEGETMGLCVVAGTGKEMRLGRWMKVSGGKNGAVVFEVPLLSSLSTTESTAETDTETKAAQI